MFSIDKILIISSLDDDEADTAGILGEYLARAIEDIATPPTIEIVQCEHAIEFQEILSSLAMAAQNNGAWPLLHLEMHGDEDSGLIFRNGSELPWAEVAGVLRKLNAATKFNLLAVFSACFGAFLNKAMLANQPAPCYALLAPTSTIDPGECLSFSMTFYRELLTTKSVGKALEATETCPLSSGIWLAMRADEWFVTLVRQWASDHCNQSSLDERAKAVYKAAKKMRSQTGSQGRHVALGAVKSLVLKQARESLTGGFFSAFFMVSLMPENRERFKTSQVEVMKKLKNLPIGKMLNL